jgi:hypothetical protein
MPKSIDDGSAAVKRHFHDLERSWLMGAIDETVERELRELERADTVVPGSEELWRDFLRACVSFKHATPEDDNFPDPSGRRLRPPGEDGFVPRDELQEDIGQAAYRILLNFPSSNQQPGSVRIINAAVWYVRLRFGELLDGCEGLRPDEILSLAVVGERAGMWPTVPELPFP